MQSSQIIPNEMNVNCYDVLEFTSIEMSNKVMTATANNFNTLNYYDCL